MSSSNVYLIVGDASALNFAASTLTCVQNLAVPPHYDTSNEKLFSFSLLVSRSTAFSDDCRDLSRLEIRGKRSESVQSHRGAAEELRDRLGQLLDQLQLCLLHARSCEGASSLVSSWIRFLICAARFDPSFRATDHPIFSASSRDLW